MTFHLEYSVVEVVLTLCSPSLKGSVYDVFAEFLQHFEDKYPKSIHQVYYPPPSGSGNDYRVGIAVATVDHHYAAQAVRTFLDALVEELKGFPENWGTTIGEYDPPFIRDYVVDYVRPAAEADI